MEDIIVNCFFYFIIVSATSKFDFKNYLQDLYPTIEDIYVASVDTGKGQFFLLDLPYNLSKTESIIL